MKKWWIFAGLFVITAIGAIAGWNWHQLQLNPRAIETTYEQRISQDLPNVESDVPLQFTPPTVESKRLMADLTALTFKRFADDDRQRAQNYILDALRSAGWQPQLQRYERDNDQGINIYAQRPGTDPQAGTILVGAHYDSVEQSPGADDNATGVAAVLEVARLFGQASTRRGLEIVLFDQEELGLVGSAAFVDRLTPSQDLKGAVILEMLGYSCDSPGCQHYPAVLPITPPTDRGNFIAVIGDQGHMPLINSFSQAARPHLPPLFTLPVPLLGPFTPDVLRSDHAPFWRKGIGAVMVTDTANFRNPHYHQPSDTIESINPVFFEGVTQLVVNALTTLLFGSGSLAQ